MAEAAIFGINSGLDTAGIIANLVSLRRRATDITVAKMEFEAQKLVSFQELKSRLQTFKSVVSGLTKESKFLSIAGGFSNNNPSATGSVVDISTTSTAASGSFTLVVKSLATSAKVISEGAGSLSEKIQIGILEVKVGSKTTFINIDSSNNTLEGLKLAINNSGAAVTASFLNDGSDDNPFRLIVSGNNTGADNSVSIQLVQRLIGTGSISTFSFTGTQTAQDAIIEVDGISITKSRNTITDVIAGATLSLKSAGSGTITLQSSIISIKDKVSTFVDGYNDLMTFLNNQLFLDVDTTLTGTLFGNFTVQNLQQTLRGLISNQVTGVVGKFQFLSQIGIRTASDGLLELDSGELSDAISEDTLSVAKLFATQQSTTSSSVTIIGFTEKTNPGIYDVRVSGGVPQLSVSGANQFTDATGSGNFFAGAEDTRAEGLNFRLASTKNGSFGTITLSLGVAAAISRIIVNLTDSSRQGPLVAEVNTITETINDFDKTIIEQDARLALFEADLKSKFTNLEVVLGRLNSQRDAFNSSIAGLASLFQK